MSSAVDLNFVDAPATESIDSAKPVVIEPHQLAVGQFYPQGDVAMKRLAAVPDGAVKVENPPLQVVEGSTQGSRHKWDSLEGVKVFEVPGATALEGFVYELSTTRTLTHPEHANHTYVVDDEVVVVQRIAQRAFAKELKRIVD